MCAVRLRYDNISLTLKLKPRDWTVSSSPHYLRMYFDSLRTFPRPATGVWPPAPLGGGGGIGPPSIYSHRMSRVLDLTSEWTSRRVELFFAAQRQ